MRKFLSVVVALLAFGAAPAQGAQTHPYASSFGAFENPGSIAVDESTGIVYVLDAAGTVNRFDAAGNPDNFTAGADADTNTLTGFSFDGIAASQIAVDNSSAATAGDLYVASTAGVDIYAPDGSHLGQLTEAAGVGFAVEPCGVAVDSAGKVYVAEYGGDVNRYVPSANPVVDADYDAQITGLDQPCHLAADSTGAVYVTTWSSGPLTKYSAGQFGDAAPRGTVVATEANDIAVDQATDAVYIDDGTQVIKRDAAGGVVGSSGSGRLVTSGGVAINRATGVLYASDPNTSDVAIFGPTVLLPDVATATPSGVTATSATLHGTLNPQGNATRYQFEYGTTTSYGSVAPAATVDIGAGSDEVPVTFDLSGLKPAITYHYRLSAVSGGTTYSGADQTFTTVGLIASMGAVNGLTTSSATFHGEVNAQSVPGVTYRFLITSSTSPYSGATAPTAVSAASAPFTVTGSLSDLAPGNTYLVRLEVSGAGAIAYSDVAVVFATPALPAYVPTLPLTVPGAAQAYGCTAPVIDPIAHHPRPGDTVKVTGRDLGVGGTIAVGAVSVRPIDWTGSAFTFLMPATATATATVPVTINCGTLSNTVGLAIYREPANAFTVSKVVVRGRAATLSVRLPGPGRLDVSGAGLASAKATIKKAGAASIKVRLSRAGVKALNKAAKGRDVALMARCRFLPTGGRSSTVTKTIIFKRKAGQR